MRQPCRDALAPYLLNLGEFAERAGFARQVVVEAGLVGSAPTGGLDLLSTDPITQPPPGSWWSLWRATYQQLLHRPEGKDTSRSFPPQRRAQPLEEGLDQRL
jgi:hypothetical protein